MATNFFERQDRARRSTGRLVVLFVIAVVGIVATTFGVVWLVVNEFGTPAVNVDHRPPPSPWHLPLFAAGGALALIVGGSLFKVVELRAGGGAGVASRLGGHRVTADTRDVAERRLLNVVEEMAIASGVPVPHVYLLEESGINAFAAGYAPGDAVLGVTRGAVNQLSREELQGVIAHEFSHVLNGDMRLSIRLIGILHGILLLGLLGQLLLRSSLYSSGGRRNSNSGQGVLIMLLIAACLVVLGFFGSFIGGLIKAAVSRQREYLADASAVQFTRNPDGIAGALKRIGGAVAGSRLKAPGANEASHLFFAQGVWEGFSGLMATHPPLEKRIRALDPTWDGSFPKASGPHGATSGDSRAAGFASAAADQSVDQNIDPVLVDNAVDQVGDPREEHRQYAQGLIASLPSEVVEAVHEPFGARGVIYCLLLDPSSDVRQKQIELLRRYADPAVLQLTSQLQRPVAGLDPRARLPLVDLAIPALRDLSAGQYERFDLCVQHLIAADRSLSLFEWTLGRVLSRHLAPNFGADRNPAIQYYALHRQGAACSMLLSTIAHVGHNQAEASRAFDAARGHLPEVELQFLSRQECGLPALQAALDTLATVTPKHRVRVVDACAEVICADGEVKLAEAELLRGIADLLDCPIPPLIAGQQVAPAGPFASGQRGAARK